MQSPLYPLAGRRLDMPEADFCWYPDFFSPSEAASFLETLTTRIAWQQETIKMYGKVLDVPRLTAWYGDPAMNYTYSGITVVPHEWTPDLLAIRQRVEAAIGVSFNSVLLNFYRHGRDSVAWHSDDEPELGEKPLIASISLGAIRLFQFKHKTDPALRATVELTHGSLLLMHGATQHFWKHQIPKSSMPVGARINLTFRHIR